MERDNRERLDKLFMDIKEPIQSKMNLKANINEKNSSFDH
jgi:hypothetical protein